MVAVLAVLAPVASGSGFESEVAQTLVCILPKSEESAAVDAAVGTAVDTAVDFVVGQHAAAAAALKPAVLVDAVQAA